MNNIGLTQVTNKNVDNFTTEHGIKVRRVINKPLRKVLQLATKRKIVVDSYPKLEKGVPYIFASTHSFDEDIIAGLATIDRNAYVLMGTTDQIEHNPQMYAAWLNGMIYVDRTNSESRKESVKKMARVLASGSSVLLFPEGGWNNTENLLCQKLFAGPYILSQLTGAKVVPISAFNEHNSNTIYMKVGEPLDFSNKEKKDALIELRDCLATMMYESIETYSEPIKRSEISENARLEFMEARCKEYMRVKWTRDVWDEELTVYKDKENPLPKDVRETFANVKVDKNNAYVMADILVQLEDDEKHNFKQYMKKNWNR